MIKIESGGTLVGSKSTTTKSKNYDAYGILVPGLTDPPTESEESFLEKCRVEIRKGFDGQSWMQLRVPIHYRDSILQTLQKENPQYEIKERELSFIWIWGDLDIQIKSIIHEKNFGIVVFTPRKKFINDVLKALTEKYPDSVFTIEEWDGDQCIFMDKEKYFPTKIQ